MKEEIKFEMKENWHAIKTLCYNDRLLEKIYDEIIKEIVKDISSIHQDFLDLIRCFIKYLNRIIASNKVPSVS